MTDGTRHGPGSSPRERGTRRLVLAPDVERRFIPARAGNARNEGWRRCQVAVHPRASGERSSSHWRHVRNTGSSPRERGTRRDRARHAFGERFIPARAGNAHDGPEEPFSTPVHPRASGERLNAVKTHRWRCGSSPRERGTRIPYLRRPRCHRFIPARAGNACACGTGGSSITVHPRASGERECSRRALSYGFGSSPRERGTHRRLRRPADVRRFIPARAGNALSARKARSLWTVHPRASGERIYGVDCRDNVGGSSPRERGTRRAGEAERGGRRFIPARAGNARCPLRSSAGKTVHPRASGERPGSVEIDEFRTGSSPRERGTLVDGGAHGGLARFIPARAGNAFQWQARWRSWPVHPRASGERSCPPMMSAAASGSSPRERGTRYAGLPWHSKRRFIPARAGNACAGRAP